MNGTDPRPPMLDEVTPFYAEGTRVTYAERWWRIEAVLTHPPRYRLRLESATFQATVTVDQRRLLAPGEAS